MYMHIYVDTSMHTVTTDEKRSYEFEGEWIGIYGRVWREEKEERNVVIKVLSKKERGRHVFWWLSSVVVEH